MPVSPAEVELLHRDEILTIAAYDHLFLEIWSGLPAKALHQRKLRELHNERLAKRPGKHALVAIVEGGATPRLDEEARSEMTERTRATRDRTVALAVVMSDQGFVAAMIRSILAGLLLVQRAPYPHKVFGTLREAASWLAPLTGSLSAQDIVQACSIVRAKKGS